MRHSAALIGAGSEVLGFDTEMSSDHDWGPRVKLFLAEEDFAENAKAIEALLKSNLPDQFRNYPVQWPQWQYLRGVPNHPELLS